MLSQRSLPFVMPSRQMSSNPSRTFIPHAGPSLTQLSSHTTSHSRNGNGILPRLYISDPIFAENPSPYWPQGYFSRPSSQQLEGSSMHSLPYITAPAGRQLSSNHTRSHSRNVSEILPRLHISDLSFAENPVLLSSYRITHILSALPDAIYRPPPSVLPHQPVRMQVSIEDSPFAELVAHLPHTTSFIRDSLASNPEARVLVHCVEGISRSVSIVAAYLIAEYGFSPNDAVDYIKTRRVVANPNFGFELQLSEYARESLSHSKPPLPPFSATP